MESPYDILGVDKNASTEAIRNAYRNLAKRFHPDLNPGNPEAEKKFKEINEANDLIGTPEARARYDAGETQAFNRGPWGGPGPEGARYYSSTQSGPGGERYRSPFEGLDEDVFESIFSSLGSMGRAPPRPLQYQMQIGFADSILGAEREIYLPGDKHLRVKIPAGIEPGKKLRFSGLGPKGEDVLVEILVSPSSTFRRVGSHVEVEAPISIADAILGGEIEVPTLDGRISMRIPPGVSSGQRLRAAGKGVPAHGSEPAGDLRAVVKIVAPKEVDAEFKAAVRAWRDRQARTAASSHRHPDGTATYYGGQA